MQRTIRNTSWIDLFFSWMARLPVSPWIIYPVLVIFFAFADQNIFINDTETGYFDSLYSAFSLVWTFIINHVLHQLSISSFEQFKPSLSVSKEKVEEFRQCFIYAPPIFAWVALVLGLNTFAIFWAAGIEEGLAETTRSLALAFVYGLLLFAGNSALIMYFMFNSIRRLRLITYLHKQVKNFDLFNLNPLRAFSRVSSGAAVSLILSVAIFQRFNSSTEDIVFLIVLSLLSIVVFVVPLIGIRNRISMERDNQINSINSDLAKVASKIRQSLNNDQLDNLGKLKDGQDGLNFQREELRKTRVWPWKSATIRGFSSAFLLPILIWLITRLLERFI
jgi:hypothetical protein